MITILRQRDFRLVFAAAFISQLGDWALITALPFYVYTATHSALASGATFLTSSLPTLLFGSFAGVFVDRWDRKRLIALGEFSQGVILLPLLLARSADTLWIVYAVSFAESTIAVFSSPAFHASVPQVVKDGQLARANSLLGAGENLARIVGPSLAGLLIIGLSLPGVIVLDAATFLVSGALLGLISTPLQSVQPAEFASRRPMRTRWLAVWREWFDGLRIVKGELWIAVLFIVPAISLLGDGMFTAVLAAFVSHVLGGSALIFGWLLTARGVGGLIGGLALGAASSFLSTPRVIAPCMALIGTVLLTMALWPSIPLTAAGLALGGVTAIGAFVTISTLLQSGVPDRFRGRVLATYSTCCALATISGNLLGGALGDALGYPLVVSLAGALSVLAGFVAFVMLRSETARRAQNGDLALQHMERDTEVFYR